MRHPSLSRVSLAALSLGACAAAACSAGPDGDTTPAEGDPKIGAELYAEMCASCHGTVAEGGLGPRLVPWSKGIAPLVSAIETTMPKGEPQKCDRECAEHIAAYLTGLTIDCGGPRALPRRSAGPCPPRATPRRPPAWTRPVSTRTRRSPTSCARRSISWCSPWRAA